MYLWIYDILKIIPFLPNAIKIIFGLYPIQMFISSMNSFAFTVCSFVVLKFSPQPFWCSCFTWDSQLQSTMQAYSTHPSLSNSHGILLGTFFPISLLFIWPSHILDKIWFKIYFLTSQVQIESNCYGFSFSWRYLTLPSCNTMSLFFSITKYKLGLFLSNSCLYHHCLKE